MGSAIELSECEKENGIEYSPAFLDWYESSVQCLDKLLMSDSMEDIRSFLPEHPERKRAYWHKVWDSGADLNFLSENEDGHKENS